MKVQNRHRKSHFGGSFVSLLCDLFTLGHFLIATALLFPCAGKASADVASRVITALMGETVTLPCSIPSKDVPTVEWSKTGLSPPDIVFLHRDGCETVGAKNPAFQYRTNLIMKELQNGNLSLIISNLQLSDEGTYQCKIVQGKQPEVVASLDLVVVAELKPNLTVVSNDGHKITLQCKVECWQLEPEITFLDHQENEITAEKMQRESHPGKCFSSSRRATLQTSTSRVTCRVHQSRINQTRSAEIHILDNRRSFVTSIIITVVVTLVAAFGIFRLAFFVNKKLGFKGKVQKSAVSEQSPDQDPTRRKQTNNVGEPEKLLTDPANPNPTPENKEDEIQQPSAKPHDHMSGKKLVVEHDRSSQSNSKLAAKVCTSNQNDLVKTKDPKQATFSQTLLHSDHNKRLSSLSLKRVSAVNSSEDSKPLIE